MDNIIRGEPLEREITSTLGQLMFMILKGHDDTILQVDYETGEELSGILLVNRAVNLAKWLKSRGIKPGTPVGIYTENRIEYIVFVVACFFIGAPIAAFNPEYTTGELKHVINLSKPTIMFCSPTTVNTLLGIKKDTPYVNNIVLFGNSKHESTIMYNDIQKGITAETVDESFEPDEFNPDETVAAILTSSGTTGLPKGVMVTHANITYFMEVGRRIVSDLEIGSITEGSTIGITPFFHSFGFLGLIVNTIRGILIVIMNKFKLQPFLEIIQKYKITTLFIPPPIVLLLVKHPTVKNYDLSSLQTLKCGVAPLGRELEQAVEKKFNVILGQGYGMTETTLAVLANRDGKKKVGSVGTIVPGMMCKVVNENGDSLGAYQEGELCFKGPLIMKGYINNDTSTREALDSENWLHTGDVGYYDKEGYFYIVDRLKELIKYNGFQVAPAELEAILITHPSITDAAVVGLPNEATGELPVAFVVKKPGTKLTEKEVQDFVASKVSNPKRLRGGVNFIDEIPRNTTGKILRRVLKEQIKRKSKL